MRLVQEVVRGQSRTRQQRASRAVGAGGSLGHQRELQAVALAVVAVGRERAVVFALVEGQSAWEGHANHPLRSLGATGELGDHSG
ncbi:MAG: hypothetical protein ACTHMZ_09515, partial [Actinomycetes bacterium]